jgi:sensor histidine kinase YesM
VVALAFTAQQLATATSPGTAEGLMAIAVPTLVFDGLWAAITFGVIAAVAHFPPGDGRIARFIGLHVGLSLVAAVAQLFAYDRILAALGLGRSMAFARLIAVNLSTGLVIYWMVLGVILVIEQRRRSRERQRIQTALENSLAVTRAAMLRAQLQPHFLFNALNTIAALIPERPGDAERMVARLGDLLRIAIDQTRGTSVTLAEELATVDAYLAIETLRLGDRLRIVLDVAPETLTALVPDLLLQPLVENAILHGLAPTRDGGTVTIAARRESQWLRLTVADDGAGTATSPVREGLGLSNTRDRIGLLGGMVEESGLIIDTAAGHGFAVTITLPWAMT